MKHQKKKKKKSGNLTTPCNLSGEAAGLALGLVMLGSKSAQAIEDMVGYAQETQHEKILRGLAVGIALVMYGRMEEADALIESLCRDKVRLKRGVTYTMSCFYFPAMMKVPVLCCIALVQHVHRVTQLCERYELD